MLRLAPSASRSMRAGDGHDARVGVDGKASAVVVLQAVGDRVGGGIGVAGRGGDADAVPLDRVLVHRVGRGVGVADRAHVELVDVVDLDGEDLVGEEPSAKWRGP